MHIGSHYCSVCRLSSLRFWAFHNVIRLCVSKQTHIVGHAIVVLVRLGSKCGWIPEPRAPAQHQATECLSPWPSRHLSTLDVQNDPSVGLDQS